MIKINVLQVPISKYPTIIGGVDTMVSNLINSIKESTKTCVFCPGTWSDKTLQVETFNGVDIYSLRLRPIYDPKSPCKGFISWLIEFPITIHRLRKIVKANDINIIHLHMALEYQFYFAVLKLIGGPKYIITVHRNDVVEYDKRSFLDRFLIKISLNQATKVIAVSKWLAELTRIKFSSLKSVSYIYNGIDLSRSKSNILPNLPEKYFLVVGTLEPYKNHYQAIKAWPKIKKHFNDVHLIIAGEGYLEPEYRQLIHALDCNHHVHLIDQQPHAHILSLLENSLGLIMPSRNEGFGYVLIEAGLMKTPVICTDIPPFIEILGAPQSGYVVPVDDINYMAETIINVLENPVEAKNLALSLHNKVISEFSSEVMAKSYLQEYLDILNSSN